MNLISVLYKHLLLYICVSEGVCVSALSFRSITCVGLCGFMSLQECTGA